MTIRAYREGILMETSPEWDIADATEPMEGEFGTIYPLEDTPPRHITTPAGVSILVAVLQRVESDGTVTLPPPAVEKGNEFVSSLRREEWLRALRQFTRELLLEPLGRDRYRVDPAQVRRAQEQPPCKRKDADVYSGNKETGHDDYRGSRKSEGHSPAPQPVRSPDGAEPLGADGTRPTPFGPDAGFSEVDFG